MLRVYLRGKCFQIPRHVRNSCCEGQEAFIERGGFQVFLQNFYYTFASSSHRVTWVGTQYVDQTLSLELENVIS